MKGKISKMISIPVEDFYFLIWIMDWDYNWYNKIIFKEIIEHIIHIL